MPLNYCNIRKRPFEGEVQKEWVNFVIFCTFTLTDEGITVFRQIPEEYI